MRELLNKKVLSWALYDWANSAFATTIMAGFFPVFFKSYWCSGIDTAISSARLGYANSLASIVVAIMAPLLGAMADRGQSRKNFLGVFLAFGVVSTAILYFIPQNGWLLAVLFYIGGVIGFSGSNIFYDSLLPGLATESQMDKTSAFGYSLGYLGGGLLFSVNVLMVLKPGLFGLSDASQAVQLAFISVALWWAMFSVPLFLNVPEVHIQARDQGWAMVRAGYRQLIDTFKEIRSLRPVFIFLLAYWFYIDGVHTIIRMAIDYGLSIGFDSNDLILALLITQFVGFPAALVFGYLGEKIGTKIAIYIGIGVYFFVTFWGAFMTQKYEFYLLAIIIGLVQGGVQALSRSFYTTLIPPEKAAEFFGFYNMMGKFAAVLGPFLMGSVGLLVLKFGGTSLLASRISISSVSILFVIGVLLLTRVERRVSVKR